MSLNDINGLSHTKWNCKIILFLLQNIVAKSSTIIRVQK